MSRLKVLSALFLLFLLLIWARLFYWQVMQNSILASDAASQYSWEYSIYPKRGKIITSDKYPFVTNEPAYLLFAQPKKLSSNAFINEITQILDMEESSILARIKREKSWVALAHSISQSQKEQIEQLAIDGLGFEDESIRFYPEASSSAHLLGFVGQDISGNPKGYFGLEGFYNEILIGKPGFVRQEKDALGLPIPFGRMSKVDPIDGSDIILNIDRGMQQIVERHLKKGIERYGAVAGGAIVMDPKSGKIYAMAAFPSYDPAKYSQYDSSLYKNPLIADTYEPGSTFKVLVMAAGLDTKSVKPGTKYEESGPINVQGYTIRTWNNEYAGKITMTQVLERSSNVGMVFVGEKIGIENFYDYLKIYGFGQKTGIDLQEEVASSLRARDDWKLIDLATASFGQGIAVTPIQLIRAVATIANKGFLITPKVVSEIKTPDNKIIKIEARPPKQVLKSSTSAIVTEMMVSAVENGEAKWAKPKGFRIAGKTGTAQIAIAGHYDEEKTIASFIGFAPASDPKFIMLVILKEPSSSPWGSETAAPLFFTISRDLFAYFNILPT